MDNKDFDKLIEKDDAFDTQKLLDGVDVSDLMADLELEEILAEYRDEKIVKDSDIEKEEEKVWVNEGFELKPIQTIEETSQERSAEPEQRGPVPEESEADSEEKLSETEESRACHEAWDPEPQALYEPNGSDGAAAPAAGPAEQKAEAPDPGMPLETVMAQVVDAVMEEEEAKRQVAQPAARRGFFSRKKRKYEDTESLGELMEEEKPEDETMNYVEEEPEEEIDDTPERGSEEATDDYHRRYKRLRKRSLLSMILMLAACALAGIEYSGVAADYLPFASIAAASLGLLAVQAIVCIPVLQRGVMELLHRHCTPELIVSLFTLTTLIDSAAVWLAEGRGEQLPLGAVATAALYFTLRGEMLRLRGLRDSCHMATYDKQPYVVTSVAGGFRKQACGTEGYIKMTDRISDQAGWYHILLPVVLVGTLVFAALTTFERFDSGNFFWYWSAILGAASAFAFTSAFGTPIGKMARRLQRGGCAVSGYSGAAVMSKKGSMILTDQDLFPPGTVFLNGMKVYAHDMIQAVSYATSLIDMSGCGLRQVFDDLRRSQGGHIYPVDDFSFYEEGGFSGMIRGESVIVGRADFLAKMGVRLPRELNLQTGVFLAVERELAAVFAIKYMPSDNVDAALQAVLHNRIKPVFAVRDFNITPALIKRKFKISTKKRCLYPELSERLALSEEEYEGNGKPSALLFREGLMPYAETVIGGKRMHTAVCRNCFWALLCSICGTLLAFYLLFSGGYQVLTPAALLLYQFLWMIPGALVNVCVSQY